MRQRRLAGLVVAFMLLVSARNASATARFVQGNNVTTPGTGSISCSMNATVNGNVLLVMFASTGTETVSSISDTNSDTFTLHNSLYTQGSTNQTGGYATAVATASNTTITINWSGSSNTHYATCAEATGVASCAASACVDIAQGLGCASGVSCASTPTQNPLQNDEIVFSTLITNSAITAGTQITSDTASCTSVPSGCGGNRWTSNATANMAAYYRAVYAGGAQTCGWTSWTGTSIAGVSCISLKSASTSSATFIQGNIAAQSTGANTCSLPASTQAGSLIVVLFAASNNTDTVSSITDSNSDTFTIVNDVYTGGTSQSGGYATAVSSGTTAGVTVNWLSSANHNAACAEIRDFGACPNGICIDNPTPPTSAITVGHGCTSAAQTCNSGAGTASQNDELILSFLMTNGAITANTQTTTDTGACTSTAPTSGSCAVTKWNSTGSASLVHGAAYYRNIASGGSQTALWNWTTTNSIAGVIQVGVKSGNPIFASPSLMLTGVGDSKWR